MVMSCPNYLEKPYKHDHIYLLVQDSHLNPMCLIENSFFQGFQGFQEDCFEFHDPIYDKLEASYLTSPITNNNL